MNFNCLWSQSEIIRNLSFIFIVSGCNKICFDYKLSTEIIWKWPKTICVKAYGNILKIGMFSSRVLYGHIYDLMQIKMLCYTTSYLAVYVIGYFLHDLWPDIIITSCMDFVMILFTWHGMVHHRKEEFCSYLEFITSWFNLIFRPHHSQWSTYWPCFFC